MKRSVLIVAGLLITAMLAVMAAGVANVTAQDGDEFTWVGEDPALPFPEDVDWLNTTRPLTLDELQGKIVLLDFWTYGCINCIHVIPDLKRLEEEYGDALVVIGVHSAKFDNEGETANILRIVRRYEVEHPVINDNEFLLWREYGVRAWPTLILIDPRGNIVGGHSGEGVYDLFQPIIDTMVQEWGDAGLLDAEPLEAWMPDLISYEHDSPLRFPGKVLVDAPGNRLFIADSNHDRIVVAALDSYEVLDIIGEGEAGLVDGDFESARFFRPQGMTLVDNVLYVADTENHVLRAADLDARTVETVAGTGEIGYERTAVGPGLDIPLNSPWDLVAHEGRIYIAMAGTHQLWFYDIADGIAGRYAGTGREALIDGKMTSAALNQPSGIDTDGEQLYFADAEASAVRTASLDPEGDLGTIVGTGLFDFGDIDGVGDEVRLQHVLGVTVADDGYLYIADTYNNKIKRIDVEGRESMTFAGSGAEDFIDGGAEEAAFYEPGGLDYANGKLYVADTNNHAIRVIDIESGEVSTVVFPNEELLVVEPETGAETSEGEQGVTLQPVAPQTDDGGAFGPAAVTLAPQMAAPGEGTILIDVNMPEGYKLNAQAPFTAIWPEDSVAQIPQDSRDIRIIVPELPLEVPVSFTVGQTELDLNLTVYWCEAINETLCFVERVNLILPLSVTEAAQGNTITFSHDLVPPDIQSSF